MTLKVITQYANRVVLWLNGKS